MITIETGALLDRQKKQAMSMKDIAEVAGLDYRTVDKILAGEVYNLHKLAAVAQALGASAIKIEFEFSPITGQELAAAE